MVETAPLGRAGRRRGGDLPRCRARIARARTAKVLLGPWTHNPTGSDHDAFMTSSHTPRHPFLAGALAGAAEVCCSYPFEFIKTLLQLKPGVYRGVLHCFFSTLSSRGPLGLYNGLSPHLLFAFPRVASRFSLYEACGRAIRGEGAPRRPLTSAEALAAGAVAGFGEAAFATVPLTTLSVRLCADAASPAPRFTRSLPHTMAALWREEGWRGWYKAPAATLLKLTTQIAVRFMLFEEISRALSAAAAVAAAGAPGRPEALEGAITVLSGALAGAATVLLNQPIDVVKSLQQGPDGARLGGILQCGRAVLARHGVAGLYAGLAPRLMRVTGEMGCSFFFFDRISKWLNVALDGVA